MGGNRLPRSLTTPKFCPGDDLIIRVVGGYLDAERGAGHLSHRDHQKSPVVRTFNSLGLDARHHRLTDRWSRQRWIQLNNFVMACTASALAFAALTHHLTPELACYLAIGEGLCSSASWAAWQSLLPDLVDPDEVLAAVSLSSAQFNLGRIIGPVFASIALVLGSVGLCFLMNAASFIFVLIVFSFVRTPKRPKPT